VRAFRFIVGDLLSGCRYLRGYPAFGTLQQLYIVGHMPSLIFTSQDYIGLLGLRRGVSGAKILQFRAP
jgi:hypothetical protein